MAGEFDRLLKRVTESFKRLGDQPLVRVKDSSGICNCPGIYVFYDKDGPCRVGTTRKLRTRVRQHHGKNPRNAAFAKRLARIATGIHGSAQEGWEKQVETYSELGKAFEAARGQIREMSVRCVVERDPDVRYLLEFYAAKELQTPHNDFRET